jgi:uncharacterized OB-fold protein
VENPSSLEPTFPRILPALNNVNRPFWTGGATGQLLIQRCRDCSRWVHPPTGQCPVCGGPLSPEPVSGTGTILTFTENFQPYRPDVPPPYVIAIVVLDEQDDLRLPTNIVGADDQSALECGQRVRVRFERNGEVYVPVFERVGEVLGAQRPKEVRTA